MLYKLNDFNGKTTFSPLNPTTMIEQEFVEKKMEQWLADNPKAVFPDDQKDMLVIFQESPFQNLMDVLAIDEEGNVIVIEVKRGQTPRDVIAQALEYASAVAEWDYLQLNQRAMHYFASRNMHYDSLLTAFQSNFEIAPGDFAESQFNRRQRIVIVGEGIEPKIEKTARWLLKHGVEISCISYTLYREHEGDYFLDFQEVVGREEAKPSTSTSSVTDVIQQLLAQLQALYRQLSESVEAWPLTRVGTNGRAIWLKAGTRFAELWPHETYFDVCIKLEDAGIPERQDSLVEGLNVTFMSRSWKLPYVFRFEQETDLNAAKTLLRRSYDLARVNHREE